MAVGSLYLSFFILPNEIGYTYYLRKNYEPTTLNNYLQVCGALHDYDLIIAAVFMLFVCWFLLKRGILIMKGAEDPSQDKIATCLLTLIVFILGVYVRQRTKSHITTPELYGHLRVKKHGKWYRLKVRLRLFKMEPKMRREISQGLFGVENDDFEQAYRTYLKSFEAVDSSGLVSQAYPFIDISLMGQEFVDEKKHVKIYAEKSVTQDGSDYDFLYDNTFILYPE